MSKDTWQKSEFVYYPLKPAEQGKLRKWAAEDFPKHPYLEEVVSAGYKVTFSLDIRNHCFACWLIPLDADSDNHGLILAGRGGTATNAFVECAFKHLVVFKGQWPRPTDDGTSWTWDSEQP